MNEIKYESKSTKRKEKESSKERNLRKRFLPIVNKYREGKLKRLLEKESEIAKLNIEIKYLKEQQALELKINKELSDNIVVIKDNRIQQLEDSKKWDDVKLFGSMLLGMALSVTIFYAAVKITNVNQ